MEVTNELRVKVIKALSDARVNFAGSEAAFSRMLDINPAQYNRIKKGDTDRVLADAKWITLARRMNISMGTDMPWQTAKTPVFDYISLQLTYCQNESTTGIFCDKADIGKTHTAKVYVRTHKAAVYVDCSQVKSKQKLVRFIAKEFGLDYTGKYNEVYEDLTYYLKAIDKPLIILDEAGDVDYAAWLELKALWNATENFCGWYMMGADGLRQKIERGIANKKVGFTEIFSRYGARYNHATPLGNEEGKQFIYNQASVIIRANYPDAPNVEKMIAKTGGSLRRIRKEIMKMKRAI